MRCDVVVYDNTNNAKKSSANTSTARRLDIAAGAQKRDVNARQSVMADPFGSPKGQGQAETPALLGMVLESPLCAASTGTNGWVSSDLAGL